MKEPKTCGTKVWVGGLLATLLAAAPAMAADAWTKRFFDGGNTGNVGDDPKLTPENVKRLVRELTIPTDGIVNATPVIASGLVVIGDSSGHVYVTDIASTRRLVKLFTNATFSTPLIGTGVQSTGLIADVTVPDGNGGSREDRRVYIGANVKPRTLFCLSLDAILAARDRLLAADEPSDGTEFLCEGADWPIMVAGVGDLEHNAGTAPAPVYNGSPTFVADQLVRVGQNLERRDVVYTPTIGADCSDGQLWAVDAYTAELIWSYDPVPNFQDIIVPAAGALNAVQGATTEDGRGSPQAGIGYGGVIWTVPTLSEDGKTLFVTTGDCVEQPQVGFQAESLVALDPVEGTVKWYHQRRLTDTTDYDIGNTAVTVEVEGENGCRMIVSPDKNGCVYGFRQAGDRPQVGQPDFDPLRPGQQRLVWRQCFLPGSLAGGFNASGAAVHGRYVFTQASGLIGTAPGDDTAGFVLDGCTGELQWATSSVGTSGSAGRDPVIASGMWFQQNGSTLQVFEAGPVENLLATVALSGGAMGGGGPAIVDGTIFVPVRGGIDVIRVGDEEVSLPVSRGSNSFAGPYPIPLGTGLGDQVALPSDPYDPNSPLVGPVETWPTMNP